MGQRTCYCPPWRLRGRLRAWCAWLPLPLAFLRWVHQREHYNCGRRAQAEADGYLDHRGRYLFQDRLTYQAWCWAKQAREDITAMRRALLELQGRGIDCP